MDKTQNQTIMRPHPPTAPAKARKAPKDGCWPVSPGGDKGSKSMEGGTENQRHLLDGDKVDSLQFKKVGKAEEGIRGET